MLSSHVNQSYSCRCSETVVVQFGLSFWTPVAHFVNELSSSSLPNEERIRAVGRDQIEE